MCLSDFEFINNKVDYAIDYINNNNLHNFFINTQHHNCKYSLRDYFGALYYFEKMGITYATYESIITASKSYTIYDSFKLPSRSQLNKFKIKLANFNFSKKLHNHYCSNNDIHTKIIMIDSSFIPNKACPKTTNIVGVNTYYKNKFGIKITSINNEFKFPLYLTIDSGNINDSKIGTKMVKKFNNELNNKLLLADSGYDSKNFKSILDDKNCEYIIPINKRNKDSTEIKKLKNQMREHSNDKINSKKNIIKTDKTKERKRGNME